MSNPQSKLSRDRGRLSPILEINTLSWDAEIEDENATSVEVLRHERSLLERANTLPSLAEEDEDADNDSDVIFADPQAVMMFDMKLVEDRLDLRRLCCLDASISDLTHMDSDSESTTSSDQWSYRPRVYYESFGSAAALLREMSGINSALLTSVPPSDFHNHAKNWGNQPIDKCAIADIPYLFISKLRAILEPLALEGQVSDLRLCLDHAIAEIYHMATQLQESRQELKQTVEDHAKEKSTLLQQLSNLQRVS